MKPPRLGAAGSMILIALGILTQVGWAQPVTYVGLDPASGLGQLRVINSDGTGDRLIPLVLPEPGFPSFSKDGRFLAVTSRDPGRPNKLSGNVFLLDLLTVQLSQITHFEDMVTPDNFVYHLPWYHALSPNSSGIAVWDFVRVRNGTTPILQIYRVADGFPRELLVINRVRTGFTQGGFGVDWHPTLDLLVYTVDVDVPVFDLTSGANAGFPGEGATLFVSPPVGGAIESGAARRLTFPRGFYQSTLGSTLLAGESDYAPAFSPNGQQVAYVRATYTLTTTLSGAGQQPSVLALRIVNLDGSNDHEIFRFQPGVYVTHLSWSRTGAQLVFDAGQQAVVNGSPATAVVPQTDEVFIVNVDGSGLRKLRSAAAGFPAWVPAGATFCNLPGLTGTGGAPGSIDDCFAPVVLRVARTPAGQISLQIAGGSSSAVFQVQTSENLTSWQTIATLPKTGDITSFTDASGSGGSRRFYRVVLGSN